MYKCFKNYSIVYTLREKTKLSSFKKRFFIHFIRRRTVDTVAIGKFLIVNLYADIRCTYVWPIKSMNE